MTDTPSPSGRTPWFQQAAQPGIWPPEAAQLDDAAPGYGAPGYAALGYGTPVAGQRAGYGQPGSLPGQQAGWGGGVSSAPGGLVSSAPGGVPIRPLGVGDILSGAFSLVRQNPAATMGLTALTVTTMSVITVVVLVIAAQTTSAVALIVVPAGLVLLALQLGGLAAAMGRSLLGRKLTIAETVRQSRAGWVLLATLLLAGMFLAFWVPLLTAANGWGLLLTLPLTAWLAVMLSLTIPVVVLERRGPIAALGRSWRLVLGSYWRTFGIYLLTYLIAMVLSLVIGFPIGVVDGLAGALGGSGTGTARVTVAILVVIDIAISSLIATIESGVLVLVYADMRMRKEGMDLVLLHAAAGRRLTGDEFAFSGPTSAYTGGADPRMGYQIGEHGGGGHRGGGYQGSGYQGSGYQGSGTADGYPASPPAS
jgi:hypothetical protein